MPAKSQACIAASRKFLLEVYVDLRLKISERDKRGSENSEPNQIFTFGKENEKRLADG